METERPTAEEIAEEIAIGTAAKDKPRRPWFAERYTRRALLLGFLAIFWSGVGALMVFLGIEHDQAWMIIIMIITFYFKDKHDGVG